MSAFRSSHHALKRLTISAIVGTMAVLMSPASAVLAAAPPPDEQKTASNAKTLENDAIRLQFDIRPDGIDWTSLVDVKADREILAGGEPFWRIVIEDAEGNRRELDNRSGWTTVSVERTVSATGEPGLGMEWQTAGGFPTGSLRVACGFSLKEARAEVQFRAINQTSATIRNLAIPIVSTRPLGADGSDDAVLFPRGPGERHTDPFAKPVRYTGDYPSGWSSYQFMAHYDPAGGVYVATHDPSANTKKIELRTQKDGKGIRMSFDWPAPDATIPGNGVDISGAAVIEVFRGDWFDAAQIYRQWAEENARWWPKEPIRTDTPAWMRETAVWAQTGGTTQSVVGRVRDFAEYMGVPTAVHWYNWHAIPFDNDYPHYFPAKPDFREGVEALQAAGVRVMPYINGRLWDTDLEDFATTARAFATKNEKGEPYTEEYGSGQKLAAMCPYPPLWGNKVYEIVTRLLGSEYGVDGVYIDQIAAARPRLCYDRSHGHPLGGGHWWVYPGYSGILQPLRAALRQKLRGKMLTTECNAEPYINLFDGYLTWHYQYDGQVPIFPAIYGGRIQFFGRAYRGGPTKDLALRMKAAQSLVWGEQIGWMGPDVIKEKIGGPFIRRMARLRYALRDYLADGRMCRPPKLEGDIPDVTADWRWQNEWPVTDRAVQAGAWKSADARLALIFVNVTSGTLSFDLKFDSAEYDLEGQRLLLTPRTENGPGKPESVPAEFRRTVRLEPYDALAWEIRPALEQ